MEDLCPSPELSSEGSEGPEGQCPVSCPPSSPPGATFNPTPTTERLPAPTHSPQSSLSHREDCSGPWNAEAHWPHLGGCRCCCCCYHLPATRDGPRDMVSPPRCRAVGMGCSAHVCGYTIYALALPRPRCLSVHLWHVLTLSPLLSLSDRGSRTPLPCTSAMAQDKSLSPS